MSARAPPLPLELILSVATCNCRPSRQETWQFEPANALRRACRLATTNVTHLIGVNKQEKVEIRCISLEGRWTDGWTDGWIEQIESDKTATNPQIVSFVREKERERYLGGVCAATEQGETAHHALRKRYLTVLRRRQQPFYFIERPHGTAVLFPPPPPGRLRRQTRHPRHSFHPIGHCETRPRRCRGARSGSSSSSSPPPACSAFFFLFAPPFSPRTIDLAPARPRPSRAAQFHRWRTTEPSLRI